ncbi:MAG: hypothetical protein ACE5D3_00515 [Candidatus Binatia bacterium]
MLRAVVTGLVALVMVVSVSACKKKTEEPKAPAAGMEAPTEPAPAPEAPET